MWSIAPISKIQSWEEVKEGAVKLDENTNVQEMIKQISCHMIKS